MFNYQYEIKEKIYNSKVLIELDYTINFIDFENYNPLFNTKCLPKKESLEGKFYDTYIVRFENLEAAKKYYYESIKEHKKDKSFNFSLNYKNLLTK